MWFVLYNNPQKNGNYTIYSTDYADKDRAAETARKLAADLGYGFNVVVAEACLLLKPEVRETKL